MHLQCLPIKKITGARGTLTTLYQPYIVYIAIWMPACIVWLYYATVWWFSDHFFLLSVLVALKLHTK